MLPPTVCVAGPGQTAFVPLSPFSPTPIAAPDGTDPREAWLLTMGKEALGDIDFLRHRTQIGEIHKARHPPTTGAAGAAGSAAATTPAAGPTGIDGVVRTVSSISARHVANTTTR